MKIATQTNSDSLKTRLAELARCDLSPASFATAWLETLAGESQVDAALLHRPAETGRLQVVAAAGDVPTEELTPSTDHERLLLETYSSGRIRFSSPLSTAAGEAAKNPADVLHIYVPLNVGDDVRGVVELVFAGDSQPEQRRDSVRAAQTACRYFAEYEERRRRREIGRRESLIDDVERFLRAVHEKLSVRHTAYAAAHDGRRLIGCDRLTVLLRRGRRYEVVAVSGVDAVENRSQAAKMLGRLTARVGGTGAPIRFNGKNEDLSPQLAEALNQYLDEAHVREVAVLPLIPELPPATDAKERVRRKPSKPIGAIVVEQIGGGESSPGRVEREELVAKHTASALNKALEHEVIPLLPLWRLCGAATRLFAPGTRAKSAAVLTLLIAAACALKFIRTDFVLHARGVLQPTERHHVFAPVDGTVKTIYVRHGQRVEAGQLLAELRNTDLDVALADVTGQRTVAYEQLLAVERSLYEDGTEIRAEERHRLAGRRSELKQQIASLDEQLRLLRMKRERLRVVSPIAGEVTTWDVERLLRDRPIRQGQILLDVADVAGAWELELQIPEDGIAHLLTAQEERGPALRVNYRLAAEPRTDRTAAVREVHYAAEIRGEEGNTVLAKATLESDSLPLLRPGAEATAKVYCGERALGYVWLHDAVDFFRTRIWFRLY